MENVEPRSGDVDAMTILRGDVVEILVSPWIVRIGGFIRDWCVEAGGINHTAGNATSEFLNLFADVKQKCIRAPTA